MAALNHLLLVDNHVVTEVIKAKLVVCSVGYVSSVCLTSFGVCERVNNKTHAHTKIAVNLAHPLTVSLSKVIVNRNDMYALACECVKISGKR